MTHRSDWLAQAIGNDGKLVWSPITVMKSFRPDLLAVPYLRMTTMAGQVGDKSIGPSTRLYAKIPQCHRDRSCESGVEGHQNGPATKFCHGLQVLTVTPNHIMYRARAGLTNDTSATFAMRQAIAAGDLQVKHQCPWHEQSVLSHCNWPCCRGQATSQTRAISQHSDHSM
jgi:hypothetical protein